MKNKSKLLKELCPGHCQEYCFLKAFFELSNFDQRMLIQLKCIEKFKYEEGERQKNDIGWENATRLWIDKGYALKFSEIYNPELSVNENYFLTIT